jgi:hypothetical protein
MQTIPERLESRLEPGERVLWIGSPDPRWFSWRGLLETLGSAMAVVILLGGAVVVVLLVSGDPGGLLDRARNWSALGRWIGTAMVVSMAVSFVLATTLVVMLIAALSWRLKKSDLYAITDRGFLWHQSVWPFPSDKLPVHRFPLEEVNAIEVVRHAGGTGTITFLDVWVSLGEDGVNPSFVRIPDVDLALIIAYAAAEEAGVPQPERPTAWQVMSRTSANRLAAIVGRAVGAVVVCLGAAWVLGGAISDQGEDMRSALQLPLLLQSSTAFPVVVGLMFATSLVGLWSLAVRSRLRRYPHLHRLRRLLAWLSVLLALVWLGAMAWIVLTLVD